MGGPHTATDSLAPRRVRWRRAWWRLHRWLGLSAGLLLVVIGLSGSLLVFKDGIERRLHPQLFQPREPGPALDATQIVSVLREQLESHEALPPPLAAELQPDTELILSWLALPRAPGDVFRAQVGPGNAPFAWLLTLEPATGGILGVRSTDAGVMRQVFLLHERLLLGRSGRTLVGLIGCVMLLSLVSGLVLWWPRGGRGARPPRAGAAFWHRRLGIVALAPLALLLVSGALLALSQYSRPLINAISPLSPALTQLVSTPDELLDDIGLDTALRLAGRALPGAQLTGLGPPRGERGVYWFAYIDPHHPLQRSRRASVWLDRYSGEVLAQRGWRQLSAGDRFLEWLLPLHNGSALGLPGRIAVCLLGLVPLLLAVTGWWLWRRR